MAQDLATAAALVLAMVFAWAAVAKVARPAATKSSVRALGLPVPALLSAVVPILEASLAAGLLLAATIAAWAALALVIAFTGVLVRAIAAGVDAPCSCFGSSRAEPVSVVEIVRNGFLGALAVLASGASSPVFADWPSLPALMSLTVAVALGRVALAVLDLRRRAGSFWSTVPGGTPRR